MTRAVGLGIQAAADRVPACMELSLPCYTESNKPEQLVEGRHLYFFRQVLPDGLLIGQYTQALLYDTSKLRLGVDYAKIVIHWPANAYSATLLKRRFGLNDKQIRQLPRIAFRRSAQRNYWLYWYKPERKNSEVRL